MAQTVLSPAAQKDVVELQDKIDRFKKGEIPEERFKAFRLTRGVYGQRQQGVQMFRLKLPYGKITPLQLKTVARLSDTYTNGNLHLTTRQNIQLHYVHLEDTPEMWAELERVGVTTREACGNTVRNVTASPFAGIDPDEPFDVTPYAQAVFEYFLRNPICQDMGRKIKMAFSSSEEDSAFTYIHDFGFIPKLDGDKRGFKVVLGGGLGAQAFMGQVATDFLPEDQLIPFIEAGLRVFDRYGERERRHKARLKFLIEPKKGIGLDGFLKLLDEEKKALPYQAFDIDRNTVNQEIPSFNQVARHSIKDLRAFEDWKAANVFNQKQAGYFAAKVRVPLGNISSDTARSLALIAEKYASDDIRFTINQGLVLKFLREENLPNVYAELSELGLAEPGFDTLADITACPGTDTCNLGVTNSTALSTVLEDLVRSEYPHLISEALIKVKISGCMNACGQHMIANIGFHGSSIKHGGKVAPAMQVVIGGGVDPDGKGYIAEKVVKIPTKRIPDSLRWLLNDFEENSAETEYFNEYFRRQGKMYFYNLLKPLADLSEAAVEDFQDWGHVEEFVPEIGVGECAGVVLDLVGTIMTDAEERLNWAKEALSNQKWADAIYYGYNSLIIGAKATLLSKDIQCNTHKGIIADFQQHIDDQGLIKLTERYTDTVLQINKQEPSQAFAEHYIKEASSFLSQIVALRRSETIAEGDEKLVVSNFYKA
ncbi:MAG: HEPN domain-containing protein [Cyclobacteriaceae bacterium]|nr:HEPN domain-containing protein [Cyclobacteriaceae bacterium HetDA_MAG_MS6]